MYVFMYVCMYVRMCTHTCGCKYVCMYACMSVYLSIYLPTYLPIYLSIYIYKHTHTHTHILYMRLGLTAGLMSESAFERSRCACIRQHTSAYVSMRGSCRKAHSKDHAAPAYVSVGKAPFKAHLRLYYGSLKALLRLA